MSAKQKPARPSAQATKNPAKAAPKTTKAGVAQQAERRPSKSGVSGSTQEARSTRRRLDWEAIERDYRTGQFSLKELERKHGAGFADISRRAKKEGWTKDLREAVKQATSAAVIAETTKGIAKAITKNVAENTKNVVLAAAEVNRQVILGHLDRARELVADTAAARAKLMALADSVADVREAATLASAIESLMRTTKGLVEIERKALDLDSPAEKPKEPPPALADVQPGQELEAYRDWVNG